jgi:AraC-like DNA-binding protein
MTESNSDLLSFNTDALPERDRFPAFCEEMFRRVIGADIARRGSMPFHGMLKIRRVGVVGIANIATTSVDMIRNASYVSDGNDAIVVQLWQQGQANTTQGKQENQIKAHDGLIIDNAKAARICMENASRFWALTIPRDRIASLTPNVARFAGSRLNNDLSLRLLFGYLEGILALGLGDQRTAQVVGSHLIDLVALALGGEGDTRGLQEQGGVRAARLAAILRAISEHATNHSLSAATVAEKLGITPRYVHLLLEQSSQTFAQHVLRKRLEKAEKLLADDKNQNRKIAAIALEAGFPDLSHFNRAFRRHFGDTPSGMRASATLGRARR